MVAIYQISTNYLETASLFLQRDLQLGQKAHEAKVCKDPTVGDGKTEKSPKFGKELELAKEEWDACYDTRDHSVEDTDAQVSKGLSDSFIGVPRCNLVSVRQVNNVIHTEASNDSNEDTLNTSKIPS